MPLITRYVLREFAKIFLVTLAVMTTFLILIGLVREAIAQGIGGSQVLRLIPYVVPNALLFTVPGTTVFAVCVFYGRLSADNELLAVKSMGIHPWRMVWPVLAVTVGLSLATVWLNDVAWSWGFFGVRRVVMESSEEIIYGILRRQGAYTSRDCSIHVKRVDGRRLIRPVFSIRGGKNKQTVSIVADEAQLTCDLQHGVLAIACRRGRISLQGSASLEFHDSIQYDVALQQLQRKNDDLGSPSHMTLSQLGEAIEGQQRHIRQLEGELCAKAAMQLATADFDELTGPSAHIEICELDGLRSNFNRLRTEPWRRWANGFSCLCFAMVGAPVAIRLRRSGILTSFFACFLPILIVYYPLLVLGVGSAKNGTTPPSGVWLGNVLLAAFGCWQFRKVVRY